MWRGGRGVRTRDRMLLDKVVKMDFERLGREGLAGLCSVRVTDERLCQLDKEEHEMSLRDLLGYIR
jgi:hypothetical protein